jgi:hypothetical protein
MSARICALLVCGIMPGLVYADPLGAVNTLRQAGCGAAPGEVPVIRADPTLHLVAQRLAGDRRLEPALDEIGYAAESATSFHVRGSREDGEIARILADRFCESLLDQRYTAGGYFQDGVESWIVLAHPGPGEIRLDAELTAELVLGLVNAARAEGQRCGTEALPPAGPVTLSPLLNAAALAHAEDMAGRGVISHEGSDGSGPADRISRAGYTWHAAGENVAAGQRSAEAVVAAWLESAGHCVTLMGRDFTQMGIAFVLAPDRNPAIYWAQVFAAP